MVFICGFILFISLLLNRMCNFTRPDFHFLQTYIAYIHVPYVKHIFPLTNKKVSSTKQVETYKIGTIQMKL